MMREYKRYDQYKDSDVDWIGEIPKEWKSIKARRLGFFSTSGVNKKINEDEKKVNLINYTDVYGNKSKEIKFKDDYMVVSANKNQLVKNKLKVGDVLFTPSSETADDIGHSAVIKEKLPNTLYSYHLVRMKFEKKVDLNYKKYLFNNHYVLRYFEMKASGTTRMTLGLDDFKNVVVFLPSKQEQQIIASFLDQKTAEIDEIINKKEKLIDHLEKYKKSVITEAVTKGKLGDKYIKEDGELVDEVEMKDSGVEWIGEIPEYWDLIKLKLDFEVNSGDYLSNDEKNKGKIPMYGGNGFNEYINQFNVDFKTVIIGRVGALCGNVHIVEGKSWITDNSLYLKQIRNNFTIDFIYYYLKSLRLNRFATKTAQPLITATLVKNMKIVYINKKLQNSIVIYLNKKAQQINNLIKKTKKSIEKYKKYKKSLIFEAVTGKIDLRDYELEGGEELAEHNNSSENERERISAVD